MSDLRPEPLTELSYENFRAELINRVNSLRQLAGKLPIVDDHAANPHLMIIEIHSLYAELTGGTIDNRALGAALVTARNLEDGTIGAESIGYNWEGVAPALVSVNLDFGAGWAEDIVLAEGHKFLSDPSYVVDEEITILAGTPSVDIALPQVTKQTHNVISNGQQEQEFTMPQVPVVKESAKVSVDAVPYKVVSHLFELTASEEGVEFRVDYKEEGILKTGNGTNGKILPLGAAIENKYETSDGADGRIVANTIEDSVDPIEDVLSNPVTITITQPFGSSGGTGRESLESMQFNGPRSLRTLEASISREDFQQNAEEVDGVIRALPLTNKEDGSIPANVTLVLIASEPAGGGETTLFSDSHNDGLIDPGNWLQLFGSWTEAAGEMFGGSQTDLIKMVLGSFPLPVEFRINAKALTTNECGIRLTKADNDNEYLYMKMTSDGGGNTTFKLGQVLAGTPTESSSVESIDSSALLDIVVAYTMNDELVLTVGGTEIVTFAPDTSFRKVKLFPHYEGEISTNQTDWVSLIELPFPNQALLDEVLDHLAAERPTLVSHVVQAGQIQATPLNLELELDTLSGFNILQVRANIVTELHTFLNLKRRDETGDYANQPGQTISLDDIYGAMKQGAGVFRIRIFWPEDFDVVPEAREMVVLGEIKWQ